MISRNAKNVPGGVAFMAIALPVGLATTKDWFPACNNESGLRETYVPSPTYQSLEFVKYKTWTFSLIHRKVPFSGKKKHNRSCFCVCSKNAIYCSSPQFCNKIYIFRYILFAGISSCVQTTFEYLIVLWKHEPSLMVKAGNCSCLIWISHGKS